MQNFVDNAWKLENSLQQKRGIKLSSATLKHDQWLACIANQSHLKVRRDTYHWTCSMVKKKSEDCCCWCKLRARRWTSLVIVLFLTQKLSLWDPIKINVLSEFKQWLYSIFTLKTVILKMTPSLSGDYKSNMKTRPTSAYVLRGSQLLKLENDNKFYTVDHTHYVKWM